MSITNLIMQFRYSLFCSPLPTKQPITNDRHNISTPNSSVQDLIVTHYDCSLQHIVNMQYYKLKEIGESKIKPPDFQMLPE